MNLAKLIEYLRDRLKTVIWVCCAVLALLVLLDALPMVVDKEHAHTGPEHWPGFWSVFGFVGCAVLIVFSKWYGHLGIMTREDYYEETADAGARPSSGAATSASANGVASSHASRRSNSAAPEDGRTPKGGHHD